MPRTRLMEGFFGLKAPKDLALLPCLKGMGFRTYLKARSL